MMSDLIQQTTNILKESQELLNRPEVKPIVTSFISWISNRIFSNKKTTQEKLALLEQQKANAETIAALEANLTYVLDGNDELEKELADKVKEVEQLLKNVGVETNKTNTVNITGNSNKVYQDINNSTINDNSINQTNITGDYVGGDKIYGDKRI